MCFTTLSKALPARLANHLAVALIALCAAVPQGRAAPLDLAFLPPDVAPQDICRAVDDAPAGTAPDAATDEAAEDTALTLQYLRRDIRNFTAEDADRWFDFILDLIAWQERLDPGFAGASADLARIALHVDAGRLDALRDSGLIDALRRDAAALTGAQKVALAQYYLDGIGVARDIATGHALIRDAALGGNVDALLTIARMAASDQPMPGWEAPLDLTVSLAFGGMLGQVNPEICRRAERIAEEYLSGRIVVRNPPVAYAWYRFAADLGSTDAAWRVAEAQMDPGNQDADRAVMLRYLDMAAARGFRPDDAQASALQAADLPAQIIDRLIGPIASPVTGGTRPSVAHLLRLDMGLNSDEIALDSPWFAYLRQVAELPTAPGRIFTRLAREVQLREGRWAGEAEATDLLTEAARRGDPEAMRLLAQILIRYRDDPARLSQAASLLTEAATRFQDIAALADLDALFRCQMPQAPLTAEAEIWADAWRATGAEPLHLAANDLAVLNPWRDPEALAGIQSMALAGQPEALSQILERVQNDPGLREDARLYWAARAETSPRALELFAGLEVDLAATPADHDLAIQLLRRVYLNNGVATALELAVALTEYDGRSPDTAAEIAALLTEAGNRGEGASIRLLSRLSANVGDRPGFAVPTRTEAQIYAQFADVIEARGDFLALMFAIPHVGPARAQDYLARAVSQMNCGSKDVDELGDAAAILRDAAQTLHWRDVGRAIEGGNTLSRLALTPQQSQAYATGAAPDAGTVMAREAAEGTPAALRSQFVLTSNPGLSGYDPAAAAAALHALADAGGPGDAAFVLQAWRTAPEDLRAAILAMGDLRPALRRAAETGSAEARHDYALLLRQEARGAADLAESARWLAEAAAQGHVPAMVEMGHVLTMGLGVPADHAAALDWFRTAARAGSLDAAEMARLLAFEAGP